MDTILVVVEQREGKLNRVSWETLTGAQAVAAQTGWTVEAAVVGDNIGAIAGEVAAKKVAKVYAIESEKLARYTPDGFAAALKAVHRQRQPKLVLCRTPTRCGISRPSSPPRWARRWFPTASGSSMKTASCCSSGRCSRASSPPMSRSAGGGPWFASFQTGAFRADQVQEGASPLRWKPCRRRLPMA